MTKSKGIIIKDPLERFWANVSIKSIELCWEWTGRKSNKGYGIMKINNHSVQSHRFSYMNFKGQIPYGMLVCHRCDNPSCVNPNHLFLGTIQDNNLDRDKKGRKALGENNGKSRLLESEVRKIIEMYKYGWATKDIAKELNKNYSTVTNIKLGRSWKWLER